MDKLLILHYLLFLFSITFILSSAIGYLCYFIIQLYFVYVYSYSVNERTILIWRVSSVSVSFRKLKIYKVWKQIL